MLRTTKTENGLVRGLPGTDARITVYKGIPYAADTSGKNRWRAPQPAENWEGVRNCFEFSPITMQATPGKDPEAFYAKEWHVDPEVPMGEDSLTVNIWTNAKSADEKKPVFVWIFGGGLKEGYSYEMEFDGERLASRDVVVVTVGYRVNVFGFLAHPELTAEAPDAPTNFGFLDQRAALEWVQRNIANFGGDPDNVTIGGQSAGGVSVFNLMCAPSCKGLFHRAIAQSSSGGSVPPVFPSRTFGLPTTLAEYEKIGANFLENTLGVKTIEEARALDAFYIRDKLVESGERHPRSSLDDKFVDRDVAGYLFSKDIHDMPLMVGYTGDEFLTYAQGDTIEEIEAWTRDRYGEHADKMLEFWRAKAGDNADDPAALKAVSAVNGNGIAARYIAEEYAAQGNPVYCYNFDPEIPGDDAGSFHSSDLWFCFETLMKCWRPFDGHHYDLARKMCNYWANFIKTGDPNGNDADGTPMPTWEKYSHENQHLLKLFDDISTEETVSEEEAYLVEANLKAFRGE